MRLWRRNGRASARRHPRRNFAGAAQIVLASRFAAARPALREGNGPYHRRRHHRKSPTRAARRLRGDGGSACVDGPAGLYHASGARRDRVRRNVPRIQHGNRFDSRLCPGARRSRAACRWRRRRTVGEHHWTRHSRRPRRPLRSMNRRLGVLISGRGSNLQSIIDAISRGELDATISVVISNRADAAGLQRARDAGIETLVLIPRDFAGRDTYDGALADALRARNVNIVCLAGFMRLVGAPLLSAFPNRVLNIHPSLLPSFPGLEAQRQAIDHGVRVSGATVHLMTAALDGGTIVVQSVVPVLEDDTAETLAARILVQEHRIYPEAIRIVLDEKWTLVGRRFVLTANESRHS